MVYAPSLRIREGDGGEFIWNREKVKYELAYKIIYELG
jgi:hypothetical protein